MRLSAFAHLGSPEVCLDKDEHLLKYLRQVLCLREEREEKDQKEKRENEQKEQGGAEGARRQGCAEVRMAWSG